MKGRRIGWKKSGIYSIICAVNGKQYKHIKRITYMLYVLVKNQVCMVMCGRNVKLRYSQKEKDKRITISEYVT